MKKDSDIAIIGIGLKLPNANNLNELENALINKQCCIGEVSEDRKKMSKFCQEALGYGDGQYVNGSFLDNVTMFDYELFGISPLEATLMDLNQRLFLETAAESIEDAGYGNERLKGTKTGVYYVGSCKMDYFEIIRRINPKFESMAEMGNLPAFAPGRMAFKYDLRGPAVFINSLCSSSLVAIHTACEAINSGECDMAIVGGSRIEILPTKKESVGIESKDSRVRAFSDNATGTVGGEGSIAIFLKKLSKAKNDCDNIYAVIKGGAVNQDGRCSSLTAPNPLAQAEVIRKAWISSNVNPMDICYIETHGTGTKLGDPIEIAGITEAYAEYEYEKQFCYIGSVKTNYGHLDSISGLLGLLKVILTVKNKKIYPQLHFDVPNRYIDFDNSPVRVCTKLIDLSDVNSIKTCGVSSFGFTGTNCHMIIQEYIDAAKVHEINNEKRHFLCLSAKSYDRLLILVKQYKKMLEAKKDISMENLCYSANLRNACYEERIIFTASNLEELYDEINIFLSENCIERYMKKDFYLDNFDSSISDILLKYIDGEDVNFKEYYRDKRCEMMSVPIYPFKRRSLWISDLVTRQK